MHNTNESNAQMQTDEFLLHYTDQHLELLLRKMMTKESTMGAGTRETTFSRQQKCLTSDICQTILKKKSFDRVAVLPPKSLSHESTTEQTQKQRHSPNTLNFPYKQQKISGDN